VTMPGMGIPLTGPLSGNTMAGSTKKVFAVKVNAMNTGIPGVQKEVKLPVLLQVDLGSGLSQTQLQEQLLNQAASLGTYIDSGTAQQAIQNAMDQLNGQIPIQHVGGDGFTTPEAPDLVTTPKLDDVQKQFDQMIQNLPVNFQQQAIADPDLMVPSAGTQVVTGVEDNLSDWLLTGTKNEKLVPVLVYPNGMTVWKDSTGYFSVIYRGGQIDGGGAGAYFSVGGQSYFDNLYFKKFGVKARGAAPAKAAAVTQLAQSQWRANENAANCNFVKAYGVSPQQALQCLQDANAPACARMTLPGMTIPNPATVTPNIPNIGGIPDPVTTANNVMENVNLTQLKLPGSQNITIPKPEIPTPGEFDAKLRGLQVPGNPLTSALQQKPVVDVRKAYSDLSGAVKTGLGAGVPLLGSPASALVDVLSGRSPTATIQKQVFNAVTWASGGVSQAGQIQKDVQKKGVPEFVSSTVRSWFNIPGVTMPSIFDQSAVQQNVQQAIDTGTQQIPKPPSKGLLGWGLFGL